MLIFQILYLLFTTSANPVLPQIKECGDSFLYLCPPQSNSGHIIHFISFVFALKNTAVKPISPWKLHLTLAVSCVLTIHYCKQSEIPRPASCKSH